MSDAKAPRTHASTSPRSAPDRQSSDGQAHLIAERLRVIGQPLRLRVIARLTKQPAYAYELTDALETTQQNLSQHLAILQRAGIVVAQKEGTRVRYELADPHVLPLLAHAQASLAHHLGELTHQIAASPGQTPGRPVCRPSTTS